MRQARFNVPKNETLGDLLQKDGGVPDFIFPGPIEKMIDLAVEMYGVSHACFLSWDERGVSESPVNQTPAQSCRLLWL